MTDKNSYKVLARKYRPETFSDLVGQEAMVRTLKNAFTAGRIAQAFIMTGIRGTGKTTTARIIAKGMNCVGLDGNGGPTTEPCGKCEHCMAIMESRHVDVFEMDAASRTGVNDIREIIDSVSYRAASARYKIYIIDEVHMLSTHAFNALLKTLEEPPEHVKFIFATTEIRKVPVTVLSRCQRFDLRRIEPETMIEMLRGIASAEGANITADALALITRAAEGSARDATSLLDQAISHGAGETTSDQVRSMLGLADRGRTLDMFEMILKGDASGALRELNSQYADGADPMAVLRDLAEITHWISVVKITPESANDPTISPSERERGKTIATKIPMRVLARMWQMLLKALEEAADAPNTMMAAEMAVIRLTHVADIPGPEDLVRKLEGMPPATARGGNSAPESGTPGSHERANGMPSGNGGTGHATALAPDRVPQLSTLPTFDRVVELIRDSRDNLLLFELEDYVRLASYRPGKIEFEPKGSAPGDLAQRLGATLQRLTGTRWMISVVNDGGEQTISEKRGIEIRENERKALENPLVKAIIESFPAARIHKIHKKKNIEAKAQIEALPEVDGEWDPFEEN
ncbi:MAG: DNA polymerase III subunit gamma/tau [Roseovarius sp.]|nr:DNA polymerase III subunit gamma/tau [Roseovarius sp.]